MCPSVRVHNMFVVFLSEEHQLMLFKAGHVHFAHVRGNAKCQYLGKSVRSENSEFAIIIQGIMC